MRVLITGANGFVGRALLPALIPFGHQARAAVRSTPTPPFPPTVEVREIGDLSRDIDWAPLVEGCDAVVHLAGIAHIGPGIAEEVYDRVNHRATVALARAAKVAGVSRFIFMSSIRAQSGPVADHMLTEDDAPRPTDAYGRSKLAAETALRTMDIPYTILRPVLVYGPNAKGNFAELVRYAAMPYPLPFGGLTKQRSLVSLSGLVQAVIFALASAHAVNQTFIVADPAPISVAAMIAALRQGLGRAPGLFSLPRPLLHALLTIAGKGDALDRIDGELVASAAKLVGAGWQAMPDTAVSLRSLAQRMAIDRR
jgi:UDP-glucose 4-epimerase